VIYGATQPLSWFGKGGAPSGKNKKTRDAMAFTQVWATEKRKTLLLPWFIDGCVQRYTEHSPPASRKGRAAARIHMREVVMGSNPCNGCPGPPFIVQGATKWQKGHYRVIR
jgi:hypothetical protein